jgi:hypothetical protein
MAPCWVKSAIRTAEYEKWLIDHGIEFGEQEDCARCVMRIACDRTINGMIVLSPLKRWMSTRNGDDSFQERDMTSFYAAIGLLINLR